MRSTKTKYLRTESLMGFEVIGGRNSSLLGNFPLIRIFSDHSAEVMVLLKLLCKL